MILTLTLNPALDLSTSAPAVEPGPKLRCAPPRREPGGGGINVARAVHILGGSARAVYAAGGAIGAVLEQLLAEEGVDARRVPVAGEARLSLSVSDSRGAQYRFVMPGPEVTRAEWQGCLDVVTQEAAGASMVVASGSIPPGAPEDIFGRLARALRATSAPLVVDTSGEPMRAALAEGVAVIRCNAREFRELTGIAEATATALLPALRGLVAAGGTGCAIVTLPGGGAVCAWEEGEAIVAPPPSVPTRSAVGAGDSFVGALVLARERGAEWPAAVEEGVAAAAAAHLTPGTMLCRREDVAQLRDQVRTIAPAG